MKGLERLHLRMGRHFSKYDPLYKTELVDLFAEVLLEILIKLEELEKREGKQCQ